MPRWQSVCSHFDPTDEKEHQMIVRIEGPRFRDQGRACSDLETPSSPINRAHLLTHQSIKDLNQQRWEESKNELLNMVRSFCEMVIQRKQAANISTYTPEPSRHYNYEDDDDDEEYSIPLNKMPQILRSIALAQVSSIMEPRDSPSWTMSILELFLKRTWKN
ncbi:hypothetical protein Tco_0150730 [Tanacetum coccineum]